MVMDVRMLSQAALDPLVSVAIQRWAETGLTGEQVATLRHLRFEVVDLPGWYLAEAGGNRVRVDSNAGGNPWFIDATAHNGAGLRRQQV